MSISCCPMWAEKRTSLSVSSGERSAATMAACAAANEIASRAFGAAPLRLISRAPRRYRQVDAASSAVTVGLNVHVLVTGTQEQSANGHRQQHDDEEDNEHLPSAAEETPPLRGAGSR